MSWHWFGPVRGLRGPRMELRRDDGLGSAGARRPSRRPSAAPVPPRCCDHLREHLRDGSGLVRDDPRRSSRCDVAAGIARTRCDLVDVGLRLPVLGRPSRPISSRGDATTAARSGVREWDADRPRCGRAPSWGPRPRGSSLQAPRRPDAARARDVDVEIARDPWGPGRACACASRGTSGRPRPAAAALDVRPTSKMRTPRKRSPSPAPRRPARRSRRGRASPRPT